MKKTSLPSKYDATASSQTFVQPSPLPSQPNAIHSLKPESKTSPPVGTLLSTVQAKARRWLWQRRLPLGKVTTLEGDSWLGKSLLALDLAARVSSGQPMPDGSPGMAGGAGVVLIAPEEDLQETMVPYLQRAGADMSRIISISSVLTTDAQTGHPYKRAFQLSDDLDMLAKAIDQVQASFVLIDPLISILPLKRTPMKDLEMRMALASLQMLIKDNEIACLIVNHQPKAGRYRSRADEMRSSLSVASSGLIVLKDPTDQSKRVLAHVTSKLSAQAAHLSFRIESDEHTGDDQPGIHWLGECTQTLQELLNPSTPAATQPRGAVRQQILEALELFHPEALSIKALADILPEISNSNLRWTLKCMTDDRQILQPARGTYCAFSPSLPPSKHQENVAHVPPSTVPEQKLPHQEHVSHVSQSSVPEQKLPHQENVPQSSVLEQKLPHQGHVSHVSQSSSSKKKLSHQKRVSQSAASKQKLSQQKQVSHASRSASSSKKLLRI